jgi:hypothetical protein
LIRDELVGQEGEGRSKQYFVTKEGWDIIEKEGERPVPKRTQGKLLEDDDE